MRRKLQRMIRGLKTIRALGKNPDSHPFQNVFQEEGRIEHAWCPKVGPVRREEGWPVF